MVEHWKGCVLRRLDRQWGLNADSGRLIDSREGWGMVVTVRESVLT